MKAEYVSSFVEPALEVFRQMTGGEAARLGAPTTTTKVTASHDCSVAITIAGTLEGLTLFSFPREAAFAIAERMIGEPVDREEILGLASSALCEFANVVTGNAMIQLESAGFSGTISCPTFIQGAQWECSVESVDQAFCLPFETPLGPLEVTIALSSQSQSKMRPDRGKVYLVDGSMFTRRHLKTVLRRYGYLVTGESADGYRALDELSRSPADFVIADLLGMGVTADAFLRKLARLPTAVIAVFVYALERTPPQVVEKTKEAGAYAALARPIDPAVLDAILRDALVNKIQVDVEQDGLEAYVTVIPSQGKAPGPETSDLLNALLQRKVLIGLKEGVLERIVREKVWAEKVLVAEGIAPTRGEPAKCKYFFKQERAHLAPFTSGDLARDMAGEADFDKLALVQLVEAGQTLAVKSAEPTVGRPGTTVSGDVLLGLQGPDPIQSGPGLVVGQDHRSLKAARRGNLRWEEAERLVLEPVQVFPRKLTSGQGDVSFHGSVLVQGDLTQGVTITASGDVEVQGDVEGGSIRAGRSILVRRVVGRNKSLLAAGQDVVCKYLQNTTVRCGGSLYVNGHVLACKVLAAGRVLLKGDSGVLFGGEAAAGEELLAVELGNDNRVDTDVHVAGPGVIGPLQELVDLLSGDFRQAVCGRTKERFIRDAAFRAYLRERVRELSLALDRLRHAPGLEPGRRGVGMLSSLWPGVKVAIGEKTFSTDSRLRESELFVERGLVQVRSLSRKRHAAANA